MARYPQKMKNVDIFVDNLWASVDIDDCYPQKYVYRWEK